MQKDFIGRNAEARALVTNVEQGRSTLVMAEAGMGKTALIEFVSPLLEQLGCLILTDRVGPGFGTWLKDIFEGLWSNGLISGQSKDPNADLKDWRKRYGNNDEKAKYLIGVCEQHDVVLVIDDASGITPSNKAWLIKFVEVCIVIACIEPSALKKQGTKRFWKLFDELKLSSLSKGESLEMLEGLISKYQVTADDMDIYKRSVLDLAQGSPFELSRLVKYHSSETLVKSREIISGTDVFVERDVKQIALAPILLILGAFTIAGRYISRVQGDMDVYVLSAIGLGLLVVFAPLLRSALKPRSR